MSSSLLVGESRIRNLLECHLVKARQRSTYVTFPLFNCLFHCIWDCFVLLLHNASVPLLAVLENSFGLQILLNNIHSEGQERQPSVKQL